MVRILITGGAGFIGSHLTDSLIKDRHEVIVYDNLSTGAADNVNKNARFIEGCITNKNMLTNAFSDVDFCYHLAAIASVPKSIDNWNWCNMVNLHGSINVFEICANIGIPVVYASSAAVYGDHHLDIMSEDEVINPLSPYGFDKYCCEYQAKLFTNLKNLNAIGLRFFNVYGHRQDPSSQYSGVISIFIDKVLQNLNLNIFGDGNQSRDFVHVDDVIRCLNLARLNVANIKCDILNVCSGHSTTINDLAHYVMQVVKKDLKIEYLTARSGEIMKSCGNPIKAANLLNFKANIDIQDGLQALISNM